VQTPAQQFIDCFDYQSSSLKLQRSYVTHNQRFIGREKLAGTYIADSKETTLPEMLVAKRYGIWIAIRIARDLAEDSVAATNISQDNRRA
jgi:hypothetical protein